ncbi:sucrose-6-phosphate hydrolase [Aerococcus agrisoli]|uniref:Sucrose-6-phosphate hydrolase n=1 Tax=Aerococcus agrisoli TaxID=2487350 RepID=A0A3N4GEH5_9LACT|nr:sucrose-6-phosphate hydrolase [Aerococcus agrisoli]RPA61263.1 sucrose-6-phosphate hydrolase [Aerococcus agrisoli]
MTFSLYQFDQQARYRAYADWSPSYLAELNALADQSPWRNQFHIEPKTGLLNDPNGFSYFNGQWHLFYQYYPFGPVHGLKSWNHLVSEDLIHWQALGLGLEADSALDSHGAYSGTAIADGDVLRLFYTGNVRDEDWTRIPLQNTVTMDSDNQLASEKMTIIPPLDLATDHFRDPMYFSQNGESWIVIGGQRKSDLKAALYLYKATDNDLTKWTFHSELTVPQADTAYMFECPNINFVDGKAFVTFCPQGISSDQLDSKNIYPNAYFIADAFTEDGTLTGAGTLQNLDYGFDAYASQLINSPDGRVLGVSWLGLPEVDYPSDDYGYQGALSLVKEYRIQNDQLFQYPVAETLQLRGEEQTFGTQIDLGHNHYEYAFTVDANQTAEIALFANVDKSKAVTLSIDTKNGTLILDRSNMGTTFATDFGTSRQLDLTPGEPVTVNIFADSSVLEIFVNHGAYVLSSRIFPGDKDQTNIIASGTRQNQVWPLSM